ncbi:alpha/beta fold hydrolase [Enemella dayhoffiae]|nr:alpha/beta hydrolase [Enemella dayhoffiae]
MPTHSSTRGRVLRVLVTFVVVLLVVPLLLLGANAVLTAYEKHNAINRLGPELRTTRVDGVGIAAHVQGQGERTIVLLPGLGTVSPISDFAPLARQLAGHARVVVLEPPGYGLSDAARTERTSANEVSDVRRALAQLDLPPPYVLMPHSLWGIHALDWAHTHPDEVAAIVGIDPTPPNNAFRGSPVPIKVPIRTAFGGNRLDRWREPAEFTGDLLVGEQEDDGYTPADRQLALEALVWNNGNATVHNQSRLVGPNVRQHAGQPYPRDLAYLAILAENGRGYWDRWVAWHTEPISNPALQQVQRVPGPHYLHETRSEEIVRHTEAFLAALGR